MNETKRLGDADIRSALRALLSQRHRDEPDTVLLEELGFCRGQARIDIVVVNGFLHGYEIKSDRDSLRRLGNQVAMFSRVLDRATLVVGERLIGEAIDHVPSWWSVVRADAGTAGVTLRTIRRGRHNPTRDPRALVELIWLNAALAWLEERGLARGLRGKPRCQVWDRICEHLGIEEIAAKVRGQLRARAIQESVAQPS